MADEEHSTPLISRQEAKAQGLKRYFTGKPCKHGHVAERLVLDGNCLGCARISAKKGSANYRKNRPEKVNAWLYEKSEEDRRAFWADQARKQRAKFPEKHKQYGKKHYERNKSELLARNKIWVQSNKDKLNAYYRDYFENKYISIFQ